MTKQTIGIGTVADDGTGDPLRTAFGKVNSNFNELYSLSTSPFGIPAAFKDVRDCSLGPLTLVSGNNDIITCDAGKRIVIQSANIYNPTGGAIVEKLQLKSSGSYYELPIASTALSASLASLAYGVNQFIFHSLNAGESFSINADAAGLTAWIRMYEIPDTAPLKTAKLFSIPDADTALYTCPADCVAYPLGTTSSTVISMSPILSCVNKTGASRTLSIYGPVAGSTVSDIANRIATASIADQANGNASPAQAVPPILNELQSVVVKADAAGAGHIFLNVMEIPIL